MLPSNTLITLWPTMPAPLTSLNSTRRPLGEMMTSSGVAARSALMLRKRGMNLGGVFGRSFGRRFTSTSTTSASARRTAMRPTSNGQKLMRALPPSTRTCVQLLIHVDHAVRRIPR